MKRLATLALAVVTLGGCDLPGQGGPDSYSCEDIEQSSDKAEELANELIDEYEQHSPRLYRQNPRGVEGEIFGDVDVVCADLEPHDEPHEFLSRFR